MLAGNAYIEINSDFQAREEGHRMRGTGAARGIGFLIFCLMVLWGSVAARAQGEWSRLLAVGEGSFSPDVRSTADGGVLWAGDVRSGHSGQTQKTVARLEPDGTTRWARLISASGEGGLGSLELAADGGCLLVGYIRSASSWSAGWIVRLDGEGQILWQRQYAATGSLTFYGATPTLDGGWAVTGGFRGNGLINCRLLLLKFNSAGTLLWQVALGSEPQGGWGRSVREGPDGSLVVAGLRGCASIPQNPWVLKIRANGQVVWQKVFYNPELVQTNKAAPTPDGGAVLAGFARAAQWSPARGWVARLGATGALLWQREFGDADSECIFTSLRVGPGDSLFLFGNKRWWTLPVSRDWLAKLDGGGNLLWEHTYSGRQQIADSDLDLRPEQGILFTAAYQTDCGRVQGTRVAATDASGGLPGECAPQDDWPSETSVGAASFTDITVASVPLLLTVQNTGAVITDLGLSNWPLCGSECSLTCSATVPPTALPGALVTFQATASASSCSGAPVFSWDFGDGTFAEGPTVTHAYSFERTYPWTLSVFADGRCCTQTGSIFVRPCPALSLSPAAFGGLVKGVACSRTVTASGGTAPYAFAVTAGSLPPGMTLSSSGVLAGAATGAGSWTFTITGTDAQGCQGSQAYTLSVYDLFFDDDSGRCRFFVNRTTGAYRWDILAGAHAGESFTGTAVLVNGGTKIYSKPGAQNLLNVTFDPIRKRAYGYFLAAGGVYSTLSDANTGNSAGSCT